MNVMTIVDSLWLLSRLILLFSFFVLSSKPIKPQATIVLDNLWRLASNGADSYPVVTLGVDKSRDRAVKNEKAHRPGQFCERIVIMIVIMI